MNNLLPSKIKTNENNTSTDIAQTIQELFYLPAIFDFVRVYQILQPQIMSFKDSFWPVPHAFGKAVTWKNAPFLFFRTCNLDNKVVTYNQ